MATPSGTTGVILAHAASKLNQVSGWGDSAISNANSAISALGGVSVGSVAAPPTAPTLSQVSSIPALSDNKRNSLPSVPNIVFNTPTAINTGAVSGGITPDTAPTFTPSVAGISLPARPADIDTGGMPVSPAMSDVMLPAAPTYTEPTLAALDLIVIPTFDFPVLPTFDATAPEFIDSPPSTLMQWAEPTYASENLDDLKVTIKRMMQGGTGLPAVVEQALFDRARGREDQVLNKAVSEAFDTFASRGFDMPPGMLAAQVNAAMQENQLKASTLSRDIMVKAAEWEIENLKFAVQQGMALEGLLQNLFNNIAQRAFEVAKLKVASDLQLYNTTVAVYNARMQGYQTQAAVYKTEIEGELAKVEVYKAELEGQKLIGEINQQKVQTFLAQYEAVKARVEVYKAMMSGAQIEAETNKLLIEGYKAEIDAYSARLAAEKVRFEAYEANVRAEAAKATIIDAEARAFAATVQAYEAGENVKIKAFEGSIARMNADIQRFIAQVQGEKARVDAIVGAAQAQAQAFQARASAEASSNAVKGEIAKMNISVAELNNQTQMHKYGAEAKMYEALSTNAVQQAKVIADSLAAAAQASASLAAGAMSAATVRISESAGASVNENWSF